MNTLELAKLEELDKCYEIVDSGREFQKAQGFIQWTDDYPNRETVENDILHGKGFVLKVDGAIAGYMCIDFDGEPAYKEIQGEWKTGEIYAVVHRMAFSAEFRGMGLADVTVQLIEKLCLQKEVHAIRVDTDFPNKRMQHILTKNGFENCGVIIFQGSGKLAYDKSF